jgi:hypothetical protein
MKRDDIAARLVALAVSVVKIVDALPNPSNALPEVLAEVDALCRILGTSKRTASINRSTPRSGSADVIR